MATWVVHLRIAERLLDRIDGLEAQPFLVGNIAPDSGVPDEKWENFEPPPEVTHFKIGEQAAYPAADLNFYRQYLAPLPSQPADTEAYSFLLGYFFHLATDNLWSQRIGQPTRLRYSQQFAAGSDFIWEVKRDWYGLDFVYLRDHPGWAVWAIFKTCQSGDRYLDFLPAEAVQQRLDYIKTYYETIDADVQAAYARPYIYLSVDEMDRFIEDAAADLLAAYRCLLTDGSSDGGQLASCTSILQLM